MPTTFFDELTKQRDEIKRIAESHGVGFVAVIGSVARGEETDSSDVDFLIDVTGTTTPWFPGGLIVDLEDLLHRPVDVVTRRALRSEIREQVLSEARPL